MPTSNPKIVNPRDYIAKIEILPVGEVIEYERNPRTHPEDQIEKIADSIRRRGFLNPVVVDSNNVVIAGHGRVRAARLLGLEKVPVIRAAHLSDDEIKAFRIFDNQIALLAGWDLDMIKLELGELTLAGYELPLLGFDQTELAAFLDTNAGLIDPDATPEVPTIPVSRTGDLWHLGRHRLLAGDATKADDVRRLFGTAKAQAMITDPPYGVAYRDTGSGTWNAAKLAKKKAGLVAPRFAAISNDEMSGKHLVTFWRDFLVLADSVLAKRAAIYCCFASLRAPEIFESYRAAGFEPRAELIWVKSRPGFNLANYKHQHEPILYGGRKGQAIEWFGDRTQTSILQVASESGSDYRHPTQKPVALFTMPIKNSTEAGDAVYEPFAGSGSVLIAAEMTGRKALAIELDPRYVDCVIIRWQNFTGRKAKHEDGQTFSELAECRNVAVTVDGSNHTASSGSTSEASTQRAVNHVMD